MFCMHCGAQIPDSATFCPVCGKTVSLTKPADATIPQQPVHYQQAPPPPYAYPQAPVAETKPSPFKAINTIVSVLVLGFISVMCFNFWGAVAGLVSSNRHLVSTIIPMASFNVSKNSTSDPVAILADQALWPALLLLPALAISIAALFVKDQKVKLITQFIAAVVAIIVLAVFL